MSLRVLRLTTVYQRTRDLLIGETCPQYILALFTLPTGSGAAERRCQVHTGYLTDSWGMMSRLSEGAGHARPLEEKTETSWEHF